MAAIDMRGLAAAAAIAAAAAVAGWLSLSGDEEAPPVAVQTQPPPDAVFELPPAPAPATEPPPNPARLTVSPAVVDMSATANATATITNVGGDAAEVSEILVTGAGLTAGGCTGRLAPAATCRLDLRSGASGGAGDIVLVGPVGILARIPFRVAPPAVPTPVTVQRPAPVDAFAAAVAAARQERNAGLRRARLVDASALRGPGRLGVAIGASEGISAPVLAQADFGPDFPAARSTLPVDLARTVLQGTPIPAVLLSSIHSQIAGEVRAMVERNVYGRDGATVVVPVGSLLIGSYVSVETGDTRLPVTWHRIIRAGDNAQFDLRGQDAVGADEQGRIGIYDALDERTMDRYGGAVLASVFEVGLEAVRARLAGDEKANRATIVLGQQSSSKIGSIADMVLKRNIDTKPIHLVSQGKRFVVVPSVDLWLSPAGRVSSQAHGKDSGWNGREVRATGPVGIAAPAELPEPRSMEAADRKGGGRR